MSAQIIFSHIICLFGLVSCHLFDVTNVRVKRGTPGSLFGYSVAQPDPWLMVGAPLEKSENSEELTGAIWKCPATKNPTDCIRIQISDEDSIGGVRNEQWLGVSLHSHSSGRRSIACAHRYMSELDIAHGICYTFDEKLHYEETWQLLDGQIEQFHYSHCQVGVSSFLLKEDMALVGAPGCHIWRGSALVFNVSSDFLTRNRRIIENRQPKADKYSYIGMSVTSGSFLSDELEYALGAPRSGLVYLYRLSSTSTIYLSDISPIVGPTEEQFGYTLAAADTNGDGLDELLVGAPFYSKNDRSGAVYVYTRSSDSFGFDMKMLTGPPDSGFGMGLSRLGDLDEDGFEDIAVGAPFSSGGGKVFIYLGSHFNHNFELVQVIDGKSLGVTPSFGYSLSGGDGRTLLVGSPFNSSVTLLTPRPVIHFTIHIDPYGFLNNVQPNMTQCNGRSHQSMNNYGCFNFPICYNSPDLKRKGEWGYSLKVGGSAMRARFRSSIQSAVRETSEIFTYFRTSYEQCNMYNIVTKRDWTIDKEPIEFQLKLVENAKGGRGEATGFFNIIAGNRNESVALLRPGKLTFNFFAKMIGDCGPGGCLAKFTFEPKILNLQEMDGFLRIVKGETENIILEVDLKNNGDPAYKTSLVVTTDTDISFIREENYHVCTAGQLGGKAVTNCEALSRGLVGKNEIDVFRLRYDTRAIKNLGIREDIIRVTVNSGTQHRPFKPHNITLNVLRRFEYPVLKGLTVPDVIVYAEKEGDHSGWSPLGPEVNFVYKVSNVVRWPLNNLELQVQIPTQIYATSTAHWIVYIIENPSIEGGECRIGEGQVDPLGFISVNSSNNGPMSWANYHETTLPAINNTISCHNRDVTICVRIRCTLPKLDVDKSAKLTIRTRLWNQTLKAIAATVLENDIFIHSMASVDVPLTSIDYQKTKGHPISNTLLGVHLWKLKRDTSSSLSTRQWIFVAMGVVIGAGLLGLVIWLCWMTGWFIRKKPPNQQDPIREALIEDFPTTEL